MVAVLVDEVVDGGGGVAPDAPVGVVVDLDGVAVADVGGGGQPRAFVEVGGAVRPTRPEPTSAAVVAAPSAIWRASSVCSSAKSR